MRGVGNSVELVQLKGLRASLSQNAFVPCVAALLLLITVFYLSTHAMVPPKLKKRPIPLEDLQPRSLRDLHDQMVRGHTSYLSFVLHRQNCWRIKFTLKNANFLR